MPPKKDPFVRVRIIALLEEPHMRSPVVILHDPQSNLVLPIWIGEPEARAIALGLQKIDVSRPLTHTLLKNVVKDLGGKVIKVAIEGIEAGTYFAVIYVRVGRKTVKIDARPSDSLALALEAKAPIFIAQSVLEIAGQENPFPSDVIEEAEGLLTKKDQQPQAQAEFSKKELKDLKDLLKQAREYEQGKGSKN